MEQYFLSFLSKKTLKEKSKWIHLFHFRLYEHLFVFPQSSYLQGTGVGKQAGKQAWDPGVVWIGEQEVWVGAKDPIKVST